MQYVLYQIFQQGNTALICDLQYASQLPRPRGRGASPSKMSEINASMMNTRNSEMPPPAINGKDLKRKTLAERAGEPLKKQQATALNKPGYSTGSYRQPSYASSIASTRPSSMASSRNISGGSYTSAVSTGSRPASVQAQRSQSAMGGSKIQRPQSYQGRPLSSMDAYSAVPSSGRGQGNRTGRNPFPSTLMDCPETLEPRQGEASYDAQAISEWASSGSPVKASRNISLPTAFSGLSLKEVKLGPTPIVGQKEDALATVTVGDVQANSIKHKTSVPSLAPTTPSQIPKWKATTAAHASGRSPSKSPRKPPQTPCPQFINKSTTNVMAQGFSMEEKYEGFSEFVTSAESTMKHQREESNNLRELLAEYKGKVDSMNKQLAKKNEDLLSDLQATKAELTSSSIALEDCKRYNNIRLDDMQRQHRRDLEDAQRQNQDEIGQLGRQHTMELDDLRRRLDRGLDEERLRHQQEIQSLSSAGAKTQEEVEAELDKRKKQLESLEDEIRKVNADVVCERNLNSDLRVKLSEAASNTINLESSVRSLRAHVDFLESDNKSQSQAFSDLDTRLQNAINAADEAKAKLQTEETLRRKLHNQVQELKGNIRVFCRVRPLLESDPVDTSAKIKYPDDDCDAKEVEIQGPEEKNSLGKISTKTNAFNFDRVFGPGSANADVFGEISQLIQSALDGYNVCIFCYGQTGSGKTHTMSAEDGMIPRAVNQIYDTAKSLEDKGWKYTMEGSFIEVYNENLNDLLGKPDELDKRKHEIRHDMQKCKTTVTDIVTVELDSPNKVQEILRQAASNRSVAATKANERSSRSHSVFILKLFGENNATGEKSEGTLNLVDLAGSERLAQSQATGERLKETQSINKSLSCLGDVIGALGNGKDGGHVPYRNSKARPLTYLLQFSLGGNSKTLMFVMISPLQGHLSETLTSLKFATKVHNTHIGTAKRQIKGGG
ncbi:MAG: hypothetical protein Q9174_001139 [Haloplaca sp. 1 TL-2023]